MPSHAIHHRRVAAVPAEVPPAGTWRVQLIGGFCLYRAGVAVPVPATEQRLTAFLAVRGPSERLTTACTLWPTKTEERSLAGLRTAVWRLNCASPGLLERSSTLLALAPGVDVDTRLLTGAGGAPPASVDQLPVPRRAAWPELLPGWYDDWVLMERELIRYRFLRLVEDAAEDALRRADATAALEWAMAAVCADPLRESAHRLVVRAQLANGNVTDAWRQVRLVSRLLREELGVEPSAQLRELVRAVRAMSTGRPARLALRTPG